MKGFSVPLTAICVVTTLAACSQQPNTESETLGAHDVTLQDEQAVREVLDRIAYAWNTGNVDGFLAEFTEEMIIDPPNGPAISGKDANRSVSKPVFENSSYDVSIEIKELVIAGDWAFDRSVMTGTATDKETGELQDIRSGIVHTFERQPNGSWKIAWDVYNTDIAPD